MNPQNIHPGTTSTGGDPSDFVSSHISPTKDTDGFSLGELGSRIRALKGIHMAAMRDAVSNPDAEQSSVDFATIREHALALLAMVGLGEGGDSKPRRLAHDAAAASDWWHPSRCRYDVRRTFPLRNPGG